MGSSEVDLLGFLGYQRRRSTALLAYNDSEILGAKNEPWVHRSVWKRLCLEAGDSKGY